MRFVPYQVKYRVPEVTTKMVPFQRLRYVPTTTCESALPPMLSQPSCGVPPPSGPSCAAPGPNCAAPGPNCAVPQQSAGMFVPQAGATPPAQFAAQNAEAYVPPGDEQYFTGPRPDPQFSMTSGQQPYDEAPQQVQMQQAQQMPPQYGQYGDPMQNPHPEHHEQQEEARSAPRFRFFPSAATLWHTPRGAATR